PEVVTLVKFMASSKLRANGIPHEFHQLDTVNSGVVIRPTHKLVQIFTDFRLFEIAGMRWQINQSTGKNILDDFFQPRVDRARSNPIGKTVVEVGQYVSGCPWRRGPGHGIGQTPKKVAPR